MTFPGNIPNNQTENNAARPEGDNPFQRRSQGEPQGQPFNPWARASRGQANASENQQASSTPHVPLHRGQGANAPRPGTPLPGGMSVPRPGAPLPGGMSVPRPAGAPLPGKQAEPRVSPFRNAKPSVATQQDNGEEGDAWEGVDQFSRISLHQNVNKESQLDKILSEENVELFKNNQSTELMFNLKKILTVNDKDFNALAGLGICCMMQDQLDKAAEYFAQAIEQDNEFKPGVLINEVLPDDPEDWLIMAEALGHEGQMEAAQDICDRVADNPISDASVRTQAVKTRKQIQQDFYAARERILIGNNPKQNVNEDESTKSSTFLILLIPVVILILVSSLMYSSNQLTNGKRYLADGIYRHYRMRGGDQKTETDGRTIEQIYQEAITCFDNAQKFNPFDKEAVFFATKCREDYVILGKWREYKEDRAWPEGNLAQAKEEYQAQKAKLAELNLSQEKELEFKKQWQDFQIKSKKDPSLTL